MLAHLVWWVEGTGSSLAAAPAGVITMRCRRRSLGSASRRTSPSDALYDRGCPFTLRHAITARAVESS